MGWNGGPRSSYKNTKALPAQYGEYPNHFRRTYVADLTFGDGMPILQASTTPRKCGKEYLSA